MKRAHFGKTAQGCTLENGLDEDMPRGVQGEHSYELGEKLGGSGSGESVVQEVGHAEVAVGKEG